MLGREGHKVYKGRAASEKEMEWLQSRKFVSAWPTREGHSERQRGKHGLDFLELCGFANKSFFLQNVVPSQVTLEDISTETLVGCMFCFDDKFN